jgi:glycosyltransferase involved in cell wall biosynthesis
MPFHSKGLIRRVCNIIFSYFRQGDVNHITGDIHYVALLLRKSKTVLTIHDCTVLADLRDLKFKLVMLFWYTLPIKKSNMIIANSEATKAELLKYGVCGSNKIKVIHIVIGEHFVRVDKSFNTEKPRILHIGTAPNKNLARLIPALEGLKCVLVVVGKVPKSIKSLMEFYNIETELKEYRLSEKEILNEYIKCDILSFVSTMEGFGMPIVEANAVGRVVITSDSTSMPEIAGHSAYLVDPYDCKSIRAGFSKIISDMELRERLIMNGYENCLRFHPHRVASQHVQIYEEVFSK